jgi:ABC-type sulfate/molybdate transport systems ATPase subunit
MVATHDPDDAATLGDTIAVLDEGRLVQHDTVETVRAWPRSELVAALSANPNVLRGEVRGGVLHLGPLRLPGRRAGHVHPRRRSDPPGASGAPIRLPGDDR